MRLSVEWLWEWPTAGVLSPVLTARVKTRTRPEFPQGGPGRHCCEMRTWLIISATSEQEFWRVW